MSTQTTAFTAAGAGAAFTIQPGQSVTNDGFASDAPWPYVAVKVVSISGTDAAVTVGVGA